MEGSWLQLEVVNNMGIKKHRSKSGGQLGVFGRFEAWLEISALSFPRSLVQTQWLPKNVSS